jgi:hypothetical protein
MSTNTAQKSPDLNEWLAKRKRQKIYDLDESPTVEEWLEIRQDAGRKIDPETAEIDWSFVRTLDPYGVYDLPEQYRQAGKEFFARSPGSDVWVCFGDLPDATREALRKKHKSAIAEIEKQTVEDWLAIRKDAGLKIDPETAEVEWAYRQTLDPYGVHLDLPDEFDQVGREYFARSPGSDIWVSFDDLPSAIRIELWEKHRSKLAFPAGLTFLREFLSRSG